MQARRQGYAQLDLEQELDPHAVQRGQAAAPAAVDQGALAIERKAVHLAKCCCCIELRTGARILLALDLISRVSNLTFLYVISNVLGTLPSEIVSMFGYIIETLWFYGILNGIGFIMIMAGIVGMMRDSLKPVKAYAVWRFVYLIISVMWPLIYAMSGGIARQAEVVCGGLGDIDFPDDTQPAFPGMDECMEQVKRVSLYSLFASLGWTLAWGGYYAMCFLSFYNEMQNEHHDRQQRDIQIQNGQFDGRQAQIVPHQAQQVIYVHQAALAQHAGYAQQHAVQMVQPGLQQAAQQPMVYPSAPSAPHDDGSRGV